MTTDSDDSPLKETDVVIDGEDKTATGEDGTTTNNDKKFEFGSKITITVTMTRYRTDFLLLCTQFSILKTTYGSMTHLTISKFYILPFIVTI